MNWIHLKWLLKDYLSRPCRNNKNLMGNKIHKKHVNIEWWNGTTNIGDCLAPIIVEWMLKQKQIESKKEIDKTKHLMTVGSLIGVGNFDSTVWGTGIMNAKNTVGLVRRSKYVRLDIRAVRGPITRELLVQSGYECPKVYGDPGILMPLIYFPKVEKQFDIGVICHHLSVVEYDGVHMISVLTDDYKEFIRQLLSCKMIVSSSLHGIILAESYGIPAIFLNVGMWDQTTKFLDWYYSTRRYNVVMISSLDQIGNVRPMTLPKLDEMREQLIRSFPYDLWN